MSGGARRAAASWWMWRSTPGVRESIPCLAVVCSSSRFAALLLLPLLLSPSLLTATTTATTTTATTTAPPAHSPRSQRSCSRASIAAAAAIRCGAVPPVPAALLRAPQLLRRCPLGTRLPVPGRTRADHAGDAGPPRTVGGPAGGRHPECRAVGGRHLQLVEPGVVSVWQTSGAAQLAQSRAALRKV